MYAYTFFILSIYSGEIVCAECSREKLKTKTGDKQLLRVSHAEYLDPDQFVML